MKSEYQRNDDRHRTIIRSFQGKQEECSLRRKIIITGILLSTMTFVMMTMIFRNFPGFTEETKTVIRNRRHFPKNNDVDTTKNLYGHVCIGHTATCCMDLYFLNVSNIEIRARIESKTNFVKMQGSYIHNNNTGTFECHMSGMGFWVVVLKGNETTTWSGDITNKELHSGAVGTSLIEFRYLTQYYLQFVDPEHLNITGDEKGDIIRVWDFQVKRASVEVNIKMNITVVDLIIPELRISPKSLRITEDKDNLTLGCSSMIQLPQNSLLTWERNSEFLGSFSLGITNIIHKGHHGNVYWINNEFIYHYNSPSLNDSGIYKCCISVQNYPKTCVNTSVIVLSPEKTQCTNNRFIPASPFQINHFQSKSLLKDGHFAIIFWKFNISEWKISSKYPQCQRYLENMELGMDKWFGTKNVNRNKRGVVEGILGGFGAIGSITNSIDIQTLQSDLETAGLVGSKSIEVQRNLNQILEKMVMKTAKVMGPSIMHLQNISLGLMDSEQHSHLARICLEIQTEYSTNFKMIAQAFQGGITPLGILQDLPKEYGFARNHTDLWVNKWVGCSNNECYSTSMVPVAGKELTLVPITVLGVPVSNTQLLYYQLQYFDFALNSDNSELEQLDLSSCLHFQSKVICLPNQDKEIFHSCFHNHTLCTARIEKVKTSFDLVTIVGRRKACFQIMTDNEWVKAFFLSCTHTENLNRGLYCIEGDLAGLGINGIRINITNMSMKNVSVLPIQYNISQVNDFPWQEWANIVQKDKGLLLELSKELQQAEIIFKHEQGNLKEIEHEWSEFSGHSWWSKFKHTVSMWGKTSVTSAAGNIIIHPFVILLIIIIVCIMFQIVIMIKMNRFHKVIKNEIKKGEEILTDMIKRKVTFGLPNSVLDDIVSVQHSTIP